MPTIIAGSRSISHREISDPRIAEAVRASGFKITTVLSGAARGVDHLGEAWARRQNLPVERYRAEWERHGNSAGYRRGEDMAEIADALVAIWDGRSRGTAHMIRTAHERGLRVFVHRVSTDPFA